MPILVVSRRTPSPPASPLAAPGISSAIAPSARAVVRVLLQQRLDLGERSLFGLARNVGGARQRHPGHGGRLDGQRAQVFGLEAVHVGLAAGPGEHLRLDSQRVQEVIYTL